MTGTQQNTPHPEKAPFPDGSGRGRDGFLPIDWIKRYRAIAGVTLREAKDAYDVGRPMPTSSAEIEEALERDARRDAMRAAAPDMFEALKMALPVLEAVQRQYAAMAKSQGMGGDGPVLEAVRAALSKATGGQHV